MIFRALFVCIVLLSGFTPVTCLAQSQTATLRVRFKSKGDPPQLPWIEPDRDKAFCGQRKIPDERLLVDQENHGIANVILYADTGRRGTPLPEVDREAKTVVISQMDCRYQPRVVFLAVGDTLKVASHDDVTHNANLQLVANAAPSVQSPPGTPLAVKLAWAEPAPIPIRCNIHPWMMGYAVILEHRYAAASDRDGVLEIKGLPPGEVTFRALHESAPLTAVILNGELTAWSGARFQVTLKPGFNDIGVVEVPAKAFEERLSVGK